MKPSPTTDPNTSSPTNLSPREHEVMEALVRGQAYKQIADKLGIGIHTVRNFIRRIYKKFQVHSSTEAVAKYLRR